MLLQKCRGDGDMFVPRRVARNTSRIKDYSRTANVSFSKYLILAGSIFLSDY